MGRINNRKSSLKCRQLWILQRASYRDSCRCLSLEYDSQSLWHRNLGDRNNRDCFWPFYGQHSLVSFEDDRSVSVSGVDSLPCFPNLSKIKWNFLQNNSIHEICVLILLNKMYTTIKLKITNTKIIQKD